METPYRAPDNFLRREYLFTHQIFNYVSKMMWHVSNNTHGIKRFI